MIFPGTQSLGPGARRSYSSDCCTGHVKELGLTLESMEALLYHLSAREIVIGLIGFTNRRVSSLLILGFGDSPCGLSQTNSWMSLELFLTTCSHRGPCWHVWVSSIDGWKPRHFQENSVIVIGIRDAILVFSKGREATLVPRIPLQWAVPEERGQYFVGGLKYSLVKHTETLCKEIREASLSLGGTLCGGFSRWSPLLNCT